RVDNGADAHHAGFQSNVQSGPGQPVVAELLPRRANRLHLGMGSRIVGCDRPIPALADHLFPQHQHRAHRHLALRLGGISEFQGAPHPGVVENAAGHSHSIVAGGLPEMSYTTREMPSISLMMRRQTRSRKSYGSRAQCAVMKSTVSTARSATTYS